MQGGSIVTLTLNPAIDTSGEIERLVPNHKLRCSNQRHDPGGGGINVARVLRRLGLNPLAVFPAGGALGEFFVKLVREQGLSHLAIPIAGETRENLVVQDHASGNQYRFLFAGPDMSISEIEACCDTALSHLKPASWLIASGSLPPGAPADTYARLAQRAAATGACFALDTSRRALRAAATAPVTLLKVSEPELVEVTGTASATGAGLIDTARALIARGPCTVAVTCGERGAYYVGEDFALAANAPAITPVSAVGAGDSFLAGLIWKLGQGASPADSLRYAVAAGSAALLSPGTDLCHLPDIERLLPVVSVRNLREVSKVFTG
jgi:6-phosphofructokinase 2